MSRRKQEYRVGIGAASMLMIFIILCLTTVAILALSSARTDRSMTERNVQVVEDYYEAVNEAQRTIARIDEALMNMRAQAVDSDEYLKMLEMLKIDTEIPVRIEGNNVEFSVDAGNDSTVDVVLKVAQFEEEGPRYRVVKHMLNYIDNWVPDNSLKLYTGEGTEDYEELNLN